MARHSPEGATNQNQTDHSNQTVQNNPSCLRVVHKEKTEEVKEYSVALITLQIYAIRILFLVLYYC